MNGVAIGPNSQKNIDALKKAEWLVVCEIYPDETSEFWKSPGIYQRGDEADPDHGVPAARRGVRREGRHLRQLGALAAMEERGAAAARHGETRPGNSGAHFPEGARAVQERRRQVPRSGSARDVELHRSAQSIACGSRQRDQRPRGGRCHRREAQPDDQGAASNFPDSPGCATTARPHAATGSFADRWTEAGAHDAAARYGGSIGAGRLSQLGVVVAGQPPRAVQPRFVRSRRASPGTRIASRSGGTKRSRNGWGSTCRISNRIRRPRTTWGRSS